MDAPRPGDRVPIAARASSTAARYSAVSFGPRRPADSAAPSPASAVLADSLACPAMTLRSWAAVDDPALVGGNAVPEGTLAGVVEEVLDGVEVAKVGRTTGHTSGTISAVELDGVTVDYGRGDVFSFDDCIEVEGDARSFSDGGDSGSLVYVKDGLQVVGLLFAGSTTGGAGGTGLTFCNPIGLVLSALGATLVV